MKRVCWPRAAWFAAILLVGAFALNGYAQSTTASVKESVFQPVSINHASAEELQKVSGFGKVLAERIIEYRTENGPFEKLEDLTGVRGIGQAKFERISKQIKL